VTTGAKAIYICIAGPAVNWTIWIAPTCVFLSAVIGSAIAYLGVRNVRAVARQRATLDFIEKVESTPHYRAINTIFSRYRVNNGFGRLHSPAEEDAADRAAIFDYLNHYEMVAIGIKSNILDDKIYRDWMLGPIIRDWNAVSEFVQRERWKWDSEKSTWSYREKLFENFQRVATSWSREAVNLSKTSSHPPRHPSGPGDERLPQPGNLA
jgi:hypothetical protein